MGNLVKVLSVRQPYADEIIYGAKWAENRTWQTRHRGELYIHASRWEGQRDQPTPGPGLTGAIIGRVQLVECVDLRFLPFDDRERRILAVARKHRLPAELENLAYATGPICWILTQRTPLSRPITGVRGRLNVWTHHIEAETAGMAESRARN